MQQPGGGPRHHRLAGVALAAQAAVGLLWSALLPTGGLGTALAVVGLAAATANAALAVLLARRPAGPRRPALWLSWVTIPLHVTVSVLVPVALAGLATGGATIALLRPRFGRLRPPARKLWLTLHVGFSVGWLGAAMAMLVLAIVGARTSDLALRRHTYEIMHIFDLAIVIPLVLLSLVTGLVAALGTPWGLVRYWWVLAKFAIALAIPLYAGVQESFWVREAMDATARDPAADLRGVDVRLWVCFVAFTLLLWVATALSNIKPWGRTRWQATREHQSSGA